jgi:hypothetical protein
MPSPATRAERAPYTRKSPDSSDRPLKIEQAHRRPALAAARSVRAALSIAASCSKWHDARPHAVGQIGVSGDLPGFL